MSSCDQGTELSLLEQVPNEILVTIMKHMVFDTLKNLSKTNKYFNELVKTPFIRVLVRLKYTIPVNIKYPALDQNNRHIPVVGAVINRNICITVGVYIPAPYYNKYVVMEVVNNECVKVKRLTYIEKGIGYFKPKAEEITLIFCNVSNSWIFDTSLHKGNFIDTKKRKREKETSLDAMITNETTVT